MDRQWFVLSQSPNVEPASNFQKGPQAVVGGTLNACCVYSTRDTGKTGTGQRQPGKVTRARTNPHAKRLSHWPTSPRGSRSERSSQPTFGPHFFFSDAHWLSSTTAKIWHHLALFHRSPPSWHNLFHFASATEGCHSVGGAAMALGIMPSDGMVRIQHDCLQDQVLGADSCLDRDKSSCQFLSLLVFPGN